MRSFLIFFVFALWAGFSWSQANQSDPPDPVDVYILVDASGTMRDHQPKALKKAEAVFQLLDPGNRVSVTYFGAKRLDSDQPVTCADEVTLGEPTFARDGVPSFPEPGGLNGRTSIGNALAAAFRHGGPNAKLVLITDGIEECGSDFVRLRRQFSDATIDVVQVGASQNTALNLLEIQPQDAQRSLSVPVPLPIEVVVDNPSPDERDGIYLFFEKWFWFIGFVLLAGSAAIFGRIDSDESVELEINTKEAQSYQELIRQGDIEAEGDLENLIETVESKIKSDEARRKRWYRYLMPKFWCADFGFLMLLGLAMAPAISFGDGLAFGKAQDTAWAVLNSDFATAFALTWIVLLFYAATQNQRLTEARRGFAIATKEAERTASAQRLETRRKAFSEYDRRFLAVGELIDGFQKAPPSAIGQLLKDDDGFVASDYRLVIARVKNIVLEERLSEAKTELEDEEISNQTERLKYIERGTKMWSITPDLPMLIERMNDESELGDDQNAWLAFARSFSQSSFERVKSAMRDLVIKLKESKK